MTRSNDSSSSSWWLTTTSRWSSTEVLGDASRVARIEEGGRLVGDDDRRLAHEHRREREQLLLPAGEPVRGPVGQVGEAEPVEGRVDARRGIRRGQPVTAQR